MNVLLIVVVAAVLGLTLIWMSETKGSSKGRIFRIVAVVLCLLVATISFMLAAVMRSMDLTGWTGLRESWRLVSGDIPGAAFWVLLLVGSFLSIRFLQTKAE